MKRPKNGIAKALHTPRYKMQVVQDKRRKALLTRIKMELREFWKGMKLGN